MVKKLPVVYPPITTFPPYADALAILCSHEEAFPWIYSHYIQTLVVDITNRGKEYEEAFSACFFVDFDNRRLANTVADEMFLKSEDCPFLKIFEIPNSFISSMSLSIIDVVKQMIDLSMYFYGYVDAAKLRGYGVRADRLFPHEIFVYGYDDTRSVFHYADFLVSANNKYTFSECSFDDFLSAFENIEESSIPVTKSFSAIQYVEYAPFGFCYTYLKDSIYG